MNFRPFLTILIFLCFSIVVQSQNESEGLVKWLTIQEAQEKNKEVKKPMIIDMYTDWCGWCKHMMKTTYSNPAIASYINTHFYPVKFDAETKDTIEYNGKIYKPLSDQPRTAHELTIKFLGSRLSYPSTMFVTNNYEYNLLTQGFLDESKLEPFLVFMVENAWQTSPYEEFEKHFNNTFRDTNFSKAAVKIYPVEDLEKLQKKKAKKVLVNIGADFCNSCVIMNKTTFMDSALANYINKNFYLVNFNVARTDTLLFKDQKYYSVMVNNFPIHSLGLKFSNNRFSLPTICVLDESLNTIDVLNFYQSPERMKPILSFFATDSFKTKSFNDFMQEYLKPPAPKTKKK